MDESAGHFSSGLEGGLSRQRCQFVTMWMVMVNVPP